MTERNRKCLGAGVLVIAVCMLAAGIIRGEVLTVFVKAIHLCLECIGLG